jgi:hypothetical protein
VLRRNGFAKIRAGLEEHLIAGHIGFFEAGIYTTIHLQANFRTGLWFGSAPRLLATAGRGASLRSVQHALERLIEIQFLRSFHIHGTRGNYPVLIHKYEPSCGALKGMRLNAIASDNWRRPIYEHVAESNAERDTEHDTESDTEDAPSLDVEVDEEKDFKNPAAKPAAASPNQKRSRTPEQQRQNIEARDYRLLKEQEARREIMIGAGPVTNATLREISALAKAKAM